MQTHWRLAVMFDAPGGDLAALEAALRQAKDAIRAAAGGHPVRIGVADRHPDLAGVAEAGQRTVDGAVEVTFPKDRAGEVPDVCRALRPVIAGLTDLASVEVMAGPMYHMVPVRTGGTFLSLAFRRFPGTTNQEFRAWWNKQHAPIAIPVLGEGLLAYDQVHVKMDAAKIAAEAFGVAYSHYDAYDNLTWADRQAFLNSISDAEAMATIAADEVGRIDDPSRRSALMTDLD